MRIPSRWRSSALALAERLPLMGALRSGTREGILLGTVLGGLLFLLLGGLLGHLNRGSGGAVIGALSGLLSGLMVGAIAGGVIGALRLPQEGSLNLSIELDNADARYAPGETVGGRVVVTAENTLRITGGTIYFVCRGFYLHDKPDENGSARPDFVRESREYLVLQTDLVPEGIIHRGASQRYPFNFTIPVGALPTHHGYICAVRWTLHAVVDAPDIPATKVNQELYVETASPALTQEAGGYQSIASSPTSQLILALPRVVYVEGETINARVNITAMESFQSPEVRAVLLRVENTPLGGNHIVYVDSWDPTSGLYRGERQLDGQGTTYVWLEDEAILSDEMSYRPAQSVTYTFALHIPSQWRPTLASKGGRVTWKVGVIASRTNLPDIRAFHEVIVCTGALQSSDILAPQRTAGERDAPRSPRARPA